MAATALNGQLPKYIGSTGGLLNSAETEEKYAITWTSSAAQAFELPTGGAAEMNEGREKVGHNPRRIGANPNPASLKFSGKEPYEV